MRRSLMALFCFLLIACQPVAGVVLQSEALPPVLASHPTATIIPSATTVPTQPLSPTAVPTPTAPPTTPNESLSVDFTVHYHPDGPLYVGDQVSIEVIAPRRADLKDKKVFIQLLKDPPQDLGSAGFGPYGIGGRIQATLTWVWDTSGLQPGDYSLRFEIQPGGPAWTETVSLLSREDVPPPEPVAHWQTATTECCIIHYITGTEAERDLSVLLAEADKQAVDAEQKMGATFNKPVEITLLPRVIGHGGFASNGIYVSYLDRNYAGNDFGLVLHHEMIHILDEQLGGELRPSILVEGLAVYLSGGHFKKEPLLPRAAALLALDWYIPLELLTDSFYTSQHEIGYLEGGALVEYLVDTYGWTAFESFYRSIVKHPSGKQSAALDTALQKNFNLTLAELDERFQQALRRQTVSHADLDDVRMTVAYYDTVRRYQQLLDPSAYFLTAWLPDGTEMRKRGIVADYLRHPHSRDNISLEAQLVHADQELRLGDYSQTEWILYKINQRIDWIEGLRPEQAQLILPIDNQRLLAAIPQFLPN